MAEEASNPAIKASPEAEPPYFNSLLRIIGMEDVTPNNSFPPEKVFEKDFLTTIHYKAAMYLTRPDVAELFQLEDRSLRTFDSHHERTEAPTDLVPVKLNDLKKNGQRNDCVVLYGELCVEPFQFGRIFTVLEDVQSQTAVLLSIVSPDPKSCNQSFAKRQYRRNEKFAVKEPVLIKADSGLVYIQIDNPFSIESTGDVVTVGENEFKRWMDCANDALDAKEWEKCVRSCTKCEMTSLSRGFHVDDRSLLDLYFNRYHAQMQLGRYEGALQDVEKLCEMDPSDIDGLKNKTQTLFALGRCKDAYRLFEMEQFKHHRLNLIQTRGDLASTYRKWATFYFDMSEAITGEEWPGGGNRYKADGDFIGPVEVGMTSNGCGRGLFATEDIKAGEVLLISKAFALVDMPTDDPVNNGLLGKVKEALTSCGDNSLKLFLSHATSAPHELSLFIPKMSDFVWDSAQEENNYLVKRSVSTIYERLLLRVIKRTAFDNSPPHVVRRNSIEAIFSNSVIGKRVYNGVSLLPSFINHSCVPNAARLGEGDIMRIHASRDIKKGQEITIPYFNVLVPSPQRHKLSEPFDFGCQCKCKRCEIETRFVKSDSQVERIYQDFFQAARVSEMNKRSSLLMPLLKRVEQHLENVSAAPGGVEESKEWIRASFLPVYLAHVACRRPNPSPDIVASLLKQANSILVTCPGDVQFLIFCQICLKFFKDAVEEPSTSTALMRLMFNVMQKVCFLVYGQQREGVLEAVVVKFIEDIF